MATTEGLAVINGPAWHSTGLRGAGVKVAIIDGGFKGYPGLRGTELPAAVTVKNFVDGESDGQVDGTTEHGTACAEIVHDIAPDATLYLAKINTDIDLQEAVNWAKTQNINIISTSLGWYNLTPGDGTGYFANLVQTARNAGIFWTTAASNDREAHWGGAFSDPDADGYHNFSGTQEVNFFGPGDGDAYYITAGYPIRVFLRWDDWTGVNQNYDLYLVRWNGSASTWQTVASSTNPQNGGAGQTPAEFAAAMTSGSAAPYGFVVKRISSNRNVNLEIFAPKVARLDEIVTARSLANLADAPAAMTVAALDVNAPYPQESYSSEGPTNGPGGTAAGGAIKPDIAGVRQRLDGELPRSGAQIQRHLIGHAACRRCGRPGERRVPGLHAGADPILVLVSDIMKLQFCPMLRWAVMDKKRTYFPTTTAQQRCLLFEVWEETGNRDEACGRAHVSQGTFYKWKPRFRGEAMQRCRAYSGARKERAQTRPAVVAQVITRRRQSRAWGKRRIADELAKGNNWVRLVSRNTVKRILYDDGLWREAADQAKKGARNRCPHEEARGQALNIDLCFVPVTHEGVAKLRAVSGSSGRLVIERQVDHTAERDWRGQVFADESGDYAEAMLDFVEVYSSRAARVNACDLSEIQALKAQKSALREEEAQLQDERRAVRQRRQLEDAAWQALRTARKAPTSTAAETAPPARTAQDDPGASCVASAKSSWRREKS